MKRTVAVAVFRGDRSAAHLEVLAIRRPPEDEELPDIWGLPAASLRAGETWEDAVRRAGSDKLGLGLEPLAVLEEGTQERPAYTLHMKLYEARIVEGKPSVPQAAEGVTQYTAWKWAAAGELREGARRGSLCCRLYLRDAG